MGVYLGLLQYCSVVDTAEILFAKKEFLFGERIDFAGSLTPLDPCHGFLCDVM